MARPSPASLRWPGAALLAAAALALAGGAKTSVPAARAGCCDSLTLRATAVPLALSEPSRSALGALAYRGGLVLTSDDKRFGGLSALHVTPDGNSLTAVSDEGYWLRARLLYDTRGFLAGVGGAEIGPLPGLDGLALANKSDADAESMAVMPDGAVIVGFEHHHRLWVYRGARPFAGRPQTFTPPPDLERAPANGGLEALVALKDGGLLAITEEMMEEGLLRGWVWRAGEWSSLHYKPRGSPRPTDAATLPSGDVLVLERSYSPVAGLRVQLRRLPQGCLEPGAVLDPPEVAEFDPGLTIDNFEGLAARLNAAGETLVYLVSDDNYNPLQKTLLLMFALRPELAKPSKGCQE